jgi:hypothetical protein
MTLGNSGLLGWFISITIEAYKKSVERKLDQKMELNERICIETERLVGDIKVKEEGLEVREKVLRGAGGV